MAIDALIFDFDGVVVDSEPVHLACFQEVLADAGLTLSREEYYSKYLGFDDHDCFLAAARDKGIELDESRVHEMIAAKTALVQERFAKSIQPLPGAVELIRAADAAGIPVAVCSGALRREIELASAAVGVLKCFAAIVSAEDVSAGKPDPAGYRVVTDRLSSRTGRSIRAARCVAVEDAPAGIAAAQAAGMKVLAVTNSYGADQLRPAQMVVASLKEVTVETLGRLV